MDEAIVIVPYDPLWPMFYNREKDLIIGAIGAYVAGIEQIGSTAVPGLGAKPIIDIMPVLEHIGYIKKCIQPLQDMGYEYKGEFGIPGRQFFLKNSEKAGARTYHLHIVAQGDVFITTHIFFRDYLREHPEKANEYQRLKIDLAARYGADRDGYSNAKSDFIQSVLNMRNKQ